MFRLAFFHFWQAHVGAGEIKDCGRRPFASQCRCWAGYPDADDHFTKSRLPHRVAQDVETLPAQLNIIVIRKEKLRDPVYLEDQTSVHPEIARVFHRLHPHRQAHGLLFIALGGKIGSVAVFDAKTHPAGLLDFCGSH